MGFYETNSRIGPDGKLLVALPLELANTDVHITVEPANRASGRNGANGSAKPDPESRHRLLDRVLGTIDDPTFERPPQDAFERREPLD